MYSGVVILCALWTLAALPSHGGCAAADDPCSNWDDNIEDLVFGTMREEIKKAGKDHVSLPDVDDSIWWHTSISTKNGKVGDLTSFKLVHFRGNEPASLVCQTSNDTHSNITIAVDVGFSDLGVTFDNFLLRLPFLPAIGDTVTKIRDSGNAVSVSVSVLTTPASKCIANINYFQVHDFGTLGVDFEHGYWNSALEHAFNLSSRLIKWVLTRTGAMRDLEKEVAKNVYDQVSQHGPEVCQLINSIFG